MIAYHLGNTLPWFHVAMVTVAVRCPRDLKSWGTIVLVLAYSLSFIVELSWFIL